MHAPNDIRNASRRALMIALWGSSLCATGKRGVYPQAPAENSWSSLPRSIQ